MQTTGRVQLMRPRDKMWSARHCRSQGIQVLRGSPANCPCFCRGSWCMALSSSMSTSSGVRPDMSHDEMWQLSGILARQATSNLQQISPEDRRRIRAMMDSLFIVRPATTEVKAVARSLSVKGDAVTPVHPSSLLCTVGPHDDHRGSGNDYGPPWQPTHAHSTPLDCPLS